MEQTETKWRDALNTIITIPTKSFSLVISSNLAEEEGSQMANGEGKLGLLSLEDYKSLSNKTEENWIRSKEEKNIGEQPKIWKTVE